VSRTPTWYVARARAMSGREVAWRATRRLRRRRADVREVDWATGPWPALVRELVAESTGDLAGDAQRIAEGHLCFWGRDGHVDPTSLPWGEGLFTWSADPKCRWELRRQQHLFALAAGGHARLCLDQMLDWLARRPPAGEGAAEAYEAAHRVVTWSWALPFAAADATEAERARIAAALSSEAELARERPSLYSSANNHRLAELAGRLAFEALTVDRSGWDDAWSELEREFVRQTFPDGGSREQAAGYFLYVLEIVWVAALYAHAVGQELGRVADRAEAALQWLDATAGVDGEPPPLGDDAEDRFIRLDYFRPRQASLLAARLRTVLDGAPELHPATASRGAPTSCVLRDSGYVVMRGRVAAGPVRLVVDVGPLGFGSLAAHGHADALAVTLDVDDETILRDSGTGTYVPAEGRDWFRLTPAHNTVSVDGGSQARPEGPHLWGRRFTTNVHAVGLDDAVDYVRASHDGYRPLADHTRAVTYLKPDLVVVLDRVTADTPCSVDLNWHTLPGRAFGGVVESLPSATKREDDAPFSPRYTWFSSAPCTAFSARGRDVVFATVLPLSTTPLVTLSHDGSSTVVDIEGRVRIVERWSGGPAFVGSA
jgi:hypothetical protein